MIYWLFVTLLAILIISSGVVFGGLSGFLGGIRQVTLLLAWPFVFFIALAFSWYSAIMAVLYIIVVWNDSLPGISEQLTLSSAGLPVIDAHFTIIFSLILGFMLALCGLLLLAFARFIAGPLKVIADVMCFVGDSTYSERLLNHLDQAYIRPRNIKAGDSVVIVAHSLGSSIALSYLLRGSDALPQLRSLIFVTLGSPIRRYLGRFFAGFCPNADTVANTLRDRYPEFLWINAYRPFDPIGGKLFTQQSQQTDFVVDVSTRQYCKLWVWAHIHYLDDPQVFSMVEQQISAMIEKSPITARKDGQKDIKYLPTAASAVFDDYQELLERNDMLAQSTGFKWGTTVILALIISINAVQLIWIENAKKADTISKTLETRGVVTEDAWLYQYLMDMPRSNSHGHPLTSDFYFVRFRPNGAEEDVAFHMAPLQVRASAQDLFKKGAQKAEIENHSFNYLSGSVAYGAARVPIRVRYLVGNPAIFEVLSLPKPSTLALIQTWAPLYIATFNMSGILLFLLTWSLLFVYLGDVKTNPNLHKAIT
jgi:hypothetical protein